MKVSRNFHLQNLLLKKFLSVWPEMTFSFWFTVTYREVP
jgi:hypothetical protein